MGVSAFLNLGFLDLPFCDIVYFLALLPFRVVVLDLPLGGAVVLDLPGCNIVVVDRLFLTYLVDFSWLPSRSRTATQADQ